VVCGDDGEWVFGFVCERGFVGGVCCEVGCVCVVVGRRWMVWVWEGERLRLTVGWVEGCGCVVWW
jgi:hypothetical protein